MAEASKLTNDQAGVDTSTRRTATIEFETQLRQTTSEAPLRALFLAFILGIWVARRR